MPWPFDTRPGSFNPDGSVLQVNQTALDYCSSLVGDGPQLLLVSLPAIKQRRDVSPTIRPDKFSASAVGEPIVEQPRFVSTP
jgi:hypothetical protein